MPGPGTWQPGDVLTADDLNAIGVWTSYTPTLGQGGTRTCTVNYASYTVINKLCIANVDLTCTTTGTAGQTITVSLPVTAASTNQEAVGSGTFYDSSATDVYLLHTLLSGTTNVRFFGETSTTNYFGATPSIALGNNDVVSFSIMFQVA